MTYHNSPILFVLFQIICLLVGLPSFAMDVHFSVISLFFCWSYLRFYYRYNDFDPLGDKTEDFSFVHMFPEVRSFMSPLPPVIRKDRDIHMTCIRINIQFINMHT